MIPSDHFVRFYNEVFQFLDEKGGLEEYYREISRHQELHCLKIFTENGLQGMYDYWEHIRIEENCDMEMELGRNKLALHMRKCPSLSKVLDNDAAPCEKYCDHCPGWVLPLLAKCGYACVYDLVDRAAPQCRMSIFTCLEEARKCWNDLLASGRDPSLCRNNFKALGKKSKTAAR
ncbi:MAG: hypothetical protein BWY31_00873 [Lentisphaerae bacterium ADurb.Bin242]|nr:MAG: hypothetical protein BWY31_00873 [Lentisphaerae bacterium ADurb.Bin242]